MARRLSRGDTEDQSGFILQPSSVGLAFPLRETLCSSTSLSFSTNDFKIKLREKLTADASSFHQQDPNLSNDNLPLSLSRPMTSWACQWRIPSSKAWKSSRTTEICFKIVWWVVRLRDTLTEMSEFDCARLPMQVQHYHRRVQRQRRRLLRPLSSRKTNWPNLKSVVSGTLGPVAKMDRSLVGMIGWILFDTCLRQETKSTIKRCSRCFFLLLFLKNRKCDLLRMSNWNTSSKWELHWQLWWSIDPWSYS